MQLDKKKFYEGLRINFPKLKVLSQNQVDSINLLVGTAEQYFTDPRHIAYLLATTYHETGYTMLPVTEYGTQSYLRSKKYWPYIGRGYVQITWDWNYRKFSKILGIDLMGKNMDRALEPSIAAKIACIGMRDGSFTGRSLKRYFNSTVNDPYNARRIINGTDKAATIAQYHNTFLKIVTDSMILQLRPLKLKRRKRRKKN